MEGLELRVVQVQSFSSACHLHIRVSGHRSSDQKLNACIFNVGGVLRNILWYTIDHVQRVIDHVQKTIDCMQKTLLHNKSVSIRDTMCKRLYFIAAGFTSEIRYARTLLHCGSFNIRCTIFALSILHIASIGETHDMEQNFTPEIKARNSI